MPALPGSPSIKRSVTPSAVVAYEDSLAVRDELVKRRAARRSSQRAEDEALATMLASEHVLARDWSTPEEDEAWAGL